MEGSTKIKSYLREQIRKGNITKKDLLRLQVKDLRKIKALRNIEESTVSETLHSVQQMVDPELISNDLEELMANQGNPLADKVSKILKGYE